VTTVENTQPDAPAADEPEVPDDHHVQKLLRLGVAVAALIGLSVITGTFAVAAFVIAVIAIVMLHEFGHFVTAKRAGMKVTEYFLGFGPRLWSVRKGETEYGVKAIPLGGYVKIIGMSNMEKDVDPDDEPRTYRQQSYRARVTVALAGIFTHFAIAFLLLMLLWTFVGVPNFGAASPKIGEISVGSPAEQAGFRVGDKVLSVDGRPAKTWDSVRPYIRDHPGQDLTFVLQRGGAPLTIVARPADVNPIGEKVGYLGVGHQPEMETTNPLSAAGRSTEQLGELTVESVKGLASFFSPSSLESYGGLLVGDTPTEAENAAPGTTANEKRPVSIVGVGRLAGQAAETGPFEVIILLVLLNVFIGIFNLVPLLPLDGGHVAIATYEKIRSRNGRRYHADVSKMMPVTAVVLVVMLALGVTSIYLDIFNPIANPFQ
jgi:membrane-associated protease RseP (regulator of RpoE activity)